MREFRAKTTKKENRKHAFNNVWVEGDLVVSGDKYYIHPHTNAFQVDNGLAKLVVLHEVIPETVGRFTGITDKKNGKKIFDGDIVRVKITQTEDIKTYGSCKYKVGFIVYNEDFGLFTCKNNFMNFINWAFNDYEVIGNIHDNKELLGE